MASAAGGVAAPVRASQNIDANRASAGGPSTGNAARRPQQGQAGQGESRPGVTVVGEKYRIGRKIGEGSFGIIYEGLNLDTNEQVAVKFESRKSEAPQLRDEYKTYQILQGVTGIPRVFYFGVESSYNVLVMELLGPSLEDLFEMCSRTFSIKTVCMLAKQMLTRVRACHERNLIYRDIKPDNFLVGRNANAPIVHLIDFGMAKYYRDPHSKVHIPYREKKSLSGTARYMSINTHLGREQSRRDDLEAVGHVFIYFLRGGLPWQGLKAATNKAKYEKIGEKKQAISVSELCAGFPEEFAKYLTYARQLKFEENPDYDYLLKLFANVMKKQHLVDDQVYDWMKLDASSNSGASSSSAEQAQRTTQRQDARVSTPRPPPVAQEPPSSGCCCFPLKK